MIFSRSAGEAIPSHYMQLCRLANTEPSQVDVRVYDVVRSQDAGRSDDVYSEIKTPPIKSRGETFALSKCPAYGPVHTAGTRAHQEVGEQNTEYEVVQPMSQV